MITTEAGAVIPRDFFLNMERVVDDLRTGGGLKFEGDATKALDLRFAEVMTVREVADL
jgi:hypothetical protein